MVEWIERVLGVGTQVGRGRLAAKVSLGIGGDVGSRRGGGSGFVRCMVGEARLPLVINVWDRQGMATALERVATGKLLNGRPVLVRLVLRPGHAARSHRCVRPGLWLRWAATPGETIPWRGVPGTVGARALRLTAAHAIGEAFVERRHGGDAEGIECGIRQSRQGRERCG